MIIMVITVMKYILLFLFYLAPYGLLYSHTIIFKDLQVVYGIVYKQDGQSIYFQTEKGPKVAKKITVARILLQDVQDNDALKKVLKKVKEDNPPRKVEPKPSDNLADVEVESIKYILAEIEKEEKEQKKKEDLRSIHEKNRESMLRAFGFPGWGHLYSGREITGYTYSSLFLLSLGGIISTSLTSERIKKDYNHWNSTALQFAFLNNPVLDTDISTNYFIYSIFAANQKYNEHTRSIHRQNSSVYITLGLYTIQIIHNYLSGKTSESELSNFLFSGIQISYLKQPYFLGTNSIGEIQYIWRF